MRRNLTGHPDGCGCEGCWYLRAGETETWPRVARWIAAALLVLAFAALLVGCRSGREIKVPSDPWPEKPDGAPYARCFEHPAKGIETSCCATEGPVVWEPWPRQTWAIYSCPAEEEPDVEPTPEPPPPTPTPGPPDPTPTPPPPEPAPEPDPEPTPEPVACEPVEWNGYCGEHRDGDPILHEDAVREAIRSVLLRDPRFREGQTLPERLWIPYASAVVEELNAVGPCASKTSPPVPSKEEVAVWTSPEQREHWDIVVGDGDRIGVQQLFLAWLCTDGDAEPGPTPEPVERTCTIRGIGDPGGDGLKRFPSRRAACLEFLDVSERGGHLRSHTIGGQRWVEDLGDGGGWYDPDCRRYLEPGGPVVAENWFGIACEGVR